MITVDRGKWERATDWYVICLNKADEKTYGKGSWSTPVDYHSSTPGIQVLHIEKSGAFLLLMPASVGWDIASLRSATPVRGSTSVEKM